MQTLTHCPVCDSDQIRPRYVGRTTRDRSDAARWQVYECERDRPLCITLSFNLAHFSTFWCERPWINVDKRLSRWSQDKADAINAEPVRFPPALGWFVG